MKAIIDHGPDPVSLALGMGEQAFHRFSSPIGVRGLAKWKGGRLDILAIESAVPGAGQFRKFISLCKDSFQTICIWQIWNESLHAALLRYGFTPQTEISGDGEVINGLRWDKAESITCPQCGRVINHPKDIEERYCGHCHRWHEDMKGQK